MKTSSIVLGLAYGDEGKGKMTAHLAKKGDLVVRFNAGQQAGHTVFKNGKRHIFSSFGSGTMNGAHTYISQYCTFYPKSFYNERQSLVENGYDPIHYIHPLAMVTTPFDIDHNLNLEAKNRHGSVGLGFGATVARNENTPYKLYAVDLTHRPILLHKLRQIAAYYNSVDVEGQIETFLHYVDMIDLNIRTLDMILPNYDHIVFEGAQGIMLDTDFGYFPHVTRSNTTSKNAVQIIKEHKLPWPQVYYCMRSYLTRHGNGHMPNEDPELKFDDQTNQPHKYQGLFRQGHHSLAELKYAIACDSTFSGRFNKNLAVICLDQTAEKVLIDGTKKSVNQLCEMMAMPFFDVLKSSTSETLYTAAVWRTSGLGKEVLPPNP